MKRLTIIIISCLLYFSSSCKEVYRDEIFNNQYNVIYGEWRHLETTEGRTQRIISTDDYTIKFIPIGKFSYNNGKTGIITIRKQNENALILDFNSLFPKTSVAYITFHGNDTMNIADPGVDMYDRLFVRISK